MGARVVMDGLGSGIVIYLSACNTFFPSLWGGYCRRRIDVGRC